MDDRDAAPYAQQALAHLGGRQFIAMTGARNLTGGADADGNPYLRFRCRFRTPAGETGNVVTVTLDVAQDLYRLELARLNSRARPRRLDPVAASNAIAVENLRQAFEDASGLYTTLFPRPEPLRQSPAAPDPIPSHNFSEGNTPMTDSTTPGTAPDAAASATVTVYRCTCERNEQDIVATREATEYWDAASQRWLINDDSRDDPYCPTCGAVLEPITVPAPACEGYDGTGASDPRFGIPGEG